MRKVWEFDLAGHEIRVVNSWLHGIKLYVDGECRDHDRSILAVSKAVLLSANLGDAGILEVEPVAWLTVEIKAFVRAQAGGRRKKVYSSQTRLRQLLPGFR
ncbi:MAG: hypothetical protein ACOH5I_24350 [Oligoflexus sp.]